VGAALCDVLARHRSGAGAPRICHECVLSRNLGEHTVRPMPPDRRQHLGRLGERLALEHLERLGFALVARNHRTRFGELDLIVHDGATLAFVEVKARRAPAAAGTSLDAFSLAKRKQVRAMARAWLAETPQRPHARALRLDAVAVTVDAHDRLLRLDHLEGAL
jgi:putative endonuclease